MQMAGSAHPQQASSIEQAAARGRRKRQMRMEVRWRSGPQPRNKRKRLRRKPAGVLSCSFARPLRERLHLFEEGEEAAADLQLFRASLDHHQVTAANVARYAFDGVDVDQRG